MKVIITGAAGFIGMHTCIKFLENGHEVLGIDNLNPYYDVNLKNARLEKLEGNSNFLFRRIDLSEKDSVEQAFNEFRPSMVVNLAAQAGVRYSLENPHQYIESNITGFLNILESSKKFDIDHLVYASSSSVYGLNKKLPFSENDNVDHPISLYAASKKSNELMAHVYSHLFSLPTTGLRFFTVYGPWGRPDMALFLFTDAIINDQEINIYNNGNMLRDFTYVDDIVEGVYRLTLKVPHGEFKANDEITSPTKSSAPFRVFNIGNSSPVNLMDYIYALEKELGKESKKVFLPMQPGDVQATQADTSELQKWIGYKPTTKIEIGISEFVRWYRNYYKVI